MKGRDWYDFLWYVARRTVPDLALLTNALLQQGPWQGDQLEVSNEWLLQTLRVKIQSVDWKVARDDVQRLLPLSEQRGLEAWAVGLFLHQVERMAAVPAHVSGHRDAARSLVLDRRLERRYHQRSAR